MCDSYGQECEILMFVKSMRISLLVFWTSSRPKNYHETFEDKKAILQRTNIQFIFYLDDIIWMRRTSVEILLYLKVGFYNQQEKFNFRTGPIITVFGSDYNSSKDFVCDKKETYLWQKRKWQKWQQNSKIDGAMPK